jgi:hypothetical protein
VPAKRSSPIHFNDPPKDRRTSNDPTPDKPVRSIDPGIPVQVDNPGSKNVRVLDPDPSKPVIDLPLHPGRGGKVGRGDGGDGGKVGRDDGDTGGKTGRGDQDGGSSGWKRPHLSLLNAAGHGLSLGNTAPVRTPSLVTAPRVIGLGTGGRRGFSTIR